MVTKYDVISRRWSSHFPVKCMANMVRITISYGFNQISSYLGVAQIC